MTVSTRSNRAGPYEGNGANTSFNYPFRIFAAADLRVIRTDADGNDTLLTLNVDYAVSGAGEPGGGIVTYPLAGAPLAPGEYLTLLRVIALTQETDIQNQGGFYPRVIEDALDRLAMQVQQNAEELTRSIKLPESSDVEGVDMTLRPAPRLFLAWSDDGKRVVSVDIGRDSRLEALRDETREFRDETGDYRDQVEIFWRETRSATLADRRLIEQFLNSAVDLGYSQQMLRWFESKQNNVPQMMLSGALAADADFGGLGAGAFSDEHHISRRIDLAGGGETINLGGLT
jgi:hypothetical protein